MRFKVLLLSFILMIYIPVYGQSPYGEVTVSTAQCELGEDCYVSVTGEFTMPMAAVEVPLIIDNEALIFDSVVEVFYPSVGSCLFIVNHKTDPLRIATIMITLQDVIPSNPGELFRIYYHTPAIADEMITKVDTLTYDYGTGVFSSLTCTPAESSGQYLLDFTAGYI